MVTRLLQCALLVGLAVSLAVLVWKWNTARSASDWLWWAIWPTMALHQTEEHVFSEGLLGPRYRFRRWARTVGFDVSPRRALALNLGVGWTLAIAAGIVGNRFVPFPLFVIGVEIVNAAWHMATTFRQGWTPGTLSAACSTLPLGIVLYGWTYTHGFATPLTLCATLALAGLSHVAFFRSLPKWEAPHRAPGRSVRQPLGD